MYYIVSASIAKLIINIINAIIVWITLWICLMGHYILLGGLEFLYIYLLFFNLALFEMSDSCADHTAHGDQNTKCSTSKGSSDEECQFESMHTRDIIY